jgi:hypothetical protein
MTGRTSTYPHVSTIIHQICLDRGYYRELAEPADEQAKLLADQIKLTRMQLGSAWEWAVKDRYRHHYGDRFQDIGELIYGGIALTPDLIDTGALDLPVPLRVNEIKCTWMSACEGDHDKLTPYWMQVMAYCRALDTTHSCLRVCFVNGDNRVMRGPIYRPWERDFTSRELAENWALIKSYQRSMGL